jgi:hypothetical protein
MTRLALRVAWVFRLATNEPHPTLPKFAEFGEGPEWAGGVNHNAALSDGIGGALWLP